MPSGVFPPTNTRMESSIALVSETGIDWGRDALMVLPRRKDAGTQDCSDHQHVEVWMSRQGEILSLEWNQEIAAICVLLEAIADGSTSWTCDSVIGTAG